MRDSHAPAAIFFGGIVGWFGHGLVAGDTLSVGDALGAGVTVAVGWWIQRALTRRSELNRVPIDHLSRLCQRIETLITGCLDRPADTKDTDPELNQALQLIANEVWWLDSLATALEIKNEHASQLLDDYYLLKDHLTGNRKVNLRAASEKGRDMRTRALILQWHICRRILDEPADIDVLAKTITARPRKKYWRKSIFMKYLQALCS